MARVRLLSIGARWFASDASNCTDTYAYKHVHSALNDVASFLRKPHLHIRLHSRGNMFVLGVCDKTKAGD